MNDINDSRAEYNALLNAVFEALEVPWEGRIFLISKGPEAIKDVIAAVVKQAKQFSLSSSVPIDELRKILDPLIKQYRRCAGRNYISDTITFEIMAINAMPELEKLFSAL